MAAHRRRRLSFTGLFAVGLGLSVGGLLPLGSLKAANDAYAPDATSGLFSNSFTLNTTTPTPGGTSSPASGDSLYFGAVTTGTAALTNNLTGFTFAGFNFLSGASAFTIGGNDFTLSGGITNNSTSLQTISNNVTLAASQSVNTNTGNVALGGIIGDGGSAFGLTKIGSGTLTLSGANTYTGTTTVNGGTLALTGSLASTALALGGGILAYAPATAGTQTFTTTALNVGGSGVSTTTGSTLNLGTTNRVAGAMLNVTGAGTTSLSGLTNEGTTSILGPWATVGTGTSTTYATLSGGNVVSFAGTNIGNVTFPTAGTSDSNYNINATGTSSTYGSNRTANTVRNTFAGTTLTFGNSSSVVSLIVNGLMNASTGTFTIARGGTNASSGIQIGANNGRELVLNAASNPIIVSATIINNAAGASSVAVTGASTVTLSGTNTYTGTTYVNAGTLVAGSAAALGTTAAGTIISPGGTLDIQAAILAEAVTVSGGGVGGNGALITSTGTGSLTGAVTLANPNVRAGGDGTLTLSAAIGDGGNAYGLTKIGAGTLILTAGATYTGATSVNAGILQLGNNTGSGSLMTSGVTVASGATLAFNRSSGTTPGFVISGAGSVTVDGGGASFNSVASTYTGGLFINNGTVSTNVNGGLGAATNAVTLGSGANANNVALTITSTNVTALRGNITVAAGTGTRFLTNSSTGSVATASGNTITLNKDLNVAATSNSGTALLTLQGVVSGAGGLIVDATNAGTVALSNANTYTGTTTVNAGTLLVNGSTASGSAVTVNGGTLGGSGTVAGTVAVNSGGTILPGPGNAVGNLTTGALTLATGSTLNAFIASDSSFSQLLAASTSANGAFSVTLPAGAAFAATGEALTIIPNGFSGAFTNQTFSAGGYTFTADYSMTGAFSLDVTPVPEPATVFSGLLMVGALGWKTRRQLGALVTNVFSGPPASA